MKKLLTYLAVTLLASGSGIFANVLSPENALNRVTNSGNIAYFGTSTRAAINPQLKMTLKATDGQPAIYMFDNGNNDGYMIVSADDAVTPLLGYADTGCIDPNNIPPALEYWLEQYQNQIAYARTAVKTRSNDETETGTRAGITLPNWGAISPKVKTSWNQDAPFYNLCPLQDGEHCYTGCVATSMAQLMNYFQYPAKGQGQISYLCTRLQRNLSMNFANVTFDWNNMLDNYNGDYTEAQANAVATLMQACGYAVQMNYSNEQSGAVSGNIPAAMVNYFNYDKSVLYLTRDFYTYSQWAQLIYDNLKNVGPVIYDGTGSGGGHSWICDGYSGNGYFHMNWGWGGMSNGYYLLDALSPTSIGIGGGLGNFNYDQGVTLNLKPASSTAPGTVQSQVVLFGTVQGNVSSATLRLFPNQDYVGWGYQGLESIKIQLAIAYVNADTPNATPTYLQSNQNYFIELSGGRYIKGYDVLFNLNSMNLSDGVKYKVTSVFRTENSDWTPTPAALGSANYLYLTKSNGKYTVENVPQMEFSANSLSIESDLYYNSAVMAKATIVNPNATELTRSVSLGLINSSGKLAFIGQPFLLSLGANASETVTWATKPIRQSGINAVQSATEFTPCLYDPETNVIFYKSDSTVIMEKSQGTTSVKITLKVEDAPFYEDEDGEVDENVYDVENAADFNVTTDLTVNKGYFTDELYLGVFSQVSGNTYNLTSTYPISNYVFMEAGESDSWTINVNFQFATIGETYGLGVLNGEGALADGKNSLSTGFYVSGIGEAGVKELHQAAEDIMFVRDPASAVLNVVSGSGISSVEVYYANGMKAPVKVNYLNSGATVDLKSLGRGIVIVTATDKAGNRKTMKLAR